MLAFGHTFALILFISKQTVLGWVILYHLYATVMNPIFAVLLILASQRIETELVDMLMPSLKCFVATDVTTRGSPPSLIEWLILAWVAGEAPSLGQ